MAKLALSLSFCISDKELASCPVLQAVHQTCFRHELAAETNKPSDSDSMRSYALGLSPKPTSWINIYIYDYHSLTRVIYSALNPCLTPGWRQVTQAYYVTSELFCKQIVVLNACSVAFLIYCFLFRRSYIYCIRSPMWTRWLWIFETIKKIYSITVSYLLPFKKMSHLRWFQYI